MEEHHEQPIEPMVVAIDVAYFEQGNAFRAHDDFESACVSYGNAIEINPHNASYYVGRSICHLVFKR